MSASPRVAYRETVKAFQSSTSGKFVQTVRRSWSVWSREDYGLNHMERGEAVTSSSIPDQSRWHGSSKEYIPSVDKGIVGSRWSLAFWPAIQWLMSKSHCLMALTTKSIRQRAWRSRLRRPSMAFKEASSQAKPGMDLLEPIMKRRGRFARRLYG